MFFLILINQKKFNKPVCLSSGNDCVGESFSMLWSGEFHADFTGYPGGEGPGAGRNINANESGGSGGGHGGRGGRARSGYHSGMAYDSISTPAQMGSGGGKPPGGKGGRGGGIF